MKTGRCGLGYTVVMKTPLIDRLADKFTVDDGCWEWTAAKGRGGYGLVTDEDHKGRAAHRELYQLLVGPIPNGLQLDHLCRNRGCVNPGHLEPVTPKVNINRGRRANAEKTHCRHGHPYTEDNIIWHQRRDRSPSRECRICTEAKNVGPKPPKTHCIHGHEFTPENTYISTEGARVCKACKRQMLRDWRARQKVST